MVDNKEVIFLKPVLQEKIWGGNKLETEFGLNLPSQKIGESWSISTHPKGVSIISYPKMFEGMGLDKFYQTYPDYFGGKVEEPFPLLTKILDASDDLSVQVHPDDVYGLKHEGELGKTECWYVISAEEGSKIIYGHTAKTQEEFKEKVEKQEWKDLFIEMPVQAGDFFDVPHGTIHAIGKGIVILETQQNSDTTYRVYDYDRLDKQGRKRDLHIQQALDVTRFPHQYPVLKDTRQDIEDGYVHHYLSNDYFSLWKWQVAGQMSICLDEGYYLVTVIKGAGKMRINKREYQLSLAHSFILPFGTQKIILTGDLELIASKPNRRVG
ncbi:mannose-6-phosphate isomerase, class I [Gemella sp. zg-570]|uniref:mannose-6-phosphate isomerase, class I n=1 Tax=Gemella sp. zg-570 TaxID=2840371 RepID=UPI001C0C93A8|nr:mannose-6-phosphate isomerase, class I [Gemella sp. zg-570]QWQ38563.1 mannose-6-phosphate isomerase, class I [Gemella sp. zg-570]